MPCSRPACNCRVDELGGTGKVDHVICRHQCEDVGCLADLNKYPLPSAPL